MRQSNSIQELDFNTEPTNTGSDKVLLTTEQLLQEMDIVEHEKFYNIPFLK